MILGDPKSESSAAAFSFVRELAVDDATAFPVRDATGMLLKDKVAGSGCGSTRGIILGGS